MRNCILSFSAVAPCLTFFQRGGRAARLILVALLIAAFAIATLPDRASAHHTSGTTYANHCRDNSDGRQNGVLGSLINDIAESEDFIRDCIALLRAAEEFTPGDDTDIDWLFKEDPNLPILLYSDMNESQWDGVYIDEVGAAPNQEYRIYRVDLSDKDLGGTLAPEWAELTALTSLDLSSNRLGTNESGESVPVPLVVWEFLDGLEAINIDGNKDLRPSPPLNLRADASRAADSETQITLSFDNVWYTLEIPRHEYRYSVNGGATWGPDNFVGDGGWIPAATGCTDPADSAMTPGIEPGSPVLCDKDDGATTPTRNRSEIQTGALPKSDTYVFQVRAVKEVVTITDDKGNNDPADDVTETTTTRSEIAQLDALGPQVLTAESDFLLATDAGYTVADPLPAAAVLVVEGRAGGVYFNPMVATGGNDVTVNLTQAASPVTDSRGSAIGQAGGRVSFPVDIKPASGAPTRINIPHQSIVRDEKPARMNIAGFFRGQGLTFTAESSEPNFATVEVESDTQDLVVTTLRPGVTVITVTATDVNRGKVVETFRLTVLSPNNAPVEVGEIPDQTLLLNDEGTELDMTPYFRDEDGDTLSFMPQSSNPRVVTASSSGPSIRFNVVGVGQARMTVLAEDPEGATASLDFTVTVLTPNATPVVTEAIPDQTLRVGDPGLALNLAPYFTDPDGDALTFSAESEDESIATVEVAGSVAIMTGAAAGETTLTAVVMDTRNASAMQEFSVIVLAANSPPEAVGAIENRALVEGGSPLSIDVAEYFIDPDGDALSYAATSASPNALQAVINDGSSMLTLSPLAPAEDVTVTVTATDGDGESAEQTFMVTIAAAADPARPTPTTQATSTATPAPQPTATPETPVAPEATQPPEPTPPAPEDVGGFPWGWVLALLVLVAGAAAAVFIVQRRGGAGPPAGTG